MKSLDTAGIPFSVLLSYNEQETSLGCEWFSKQPEALLQIPAGDPAKEMGTLRDLLFHILIVEWVYAKVLNAEHWENEWQKFDAQYQWHLRGRGGSPAEAACVCQFSTLLLVQKCSRILWGHGG
ncbi:MAG: hypothetical protein WB623_17520 [Candidatus Sulfotelmatobacter sp.]|jgi:hypothetical protein